MDQAKKWIHCDGAYRLGLTGKGVGVAVLDTGIFPHRDFENRIVVFNDMLKRRFLPYDDNGHGTHISGISEEKAFLPMGDIRVLHRSAA